MTRTFIQTDEFVKMWRYLGLEDNELRKLELEILKEPKIGKVIRGTGKLRKMRFVFNRGGKRGGIRVCYIDFSEKETIYLITAYSKREKDNLTKEECNNIKKMIEILEKNL